MAGGAGGAGVVRRNHWEVIAQYVEHMDDDVIMAVTRLEDTVSYLIGSVSQGGNRSVIHLVLL